MEYVLAFMLSNLLLFVISAMTTLHITFHVQRKGEDDQVRTEMSAWFGLIRMQYEVNTIQLSSDFSGLIYETEMESPQEPLDQKYFKIHPKEMLKMQHRLYEFIIHIHALHEVLKKFLHTIRIQHLEWKSAFGTGSAAETGMLSGMVWGLKSTLLGAVSHYMRLKTVPLYHVQPLFQKQRLETEMKCMIRFRLGNAMLAGIRILLNLRKRA